VELDCHKVQSQELCAYNSRGVTRKTDWEFSSCSGEVCGKKIIFDQETISPQEVSQFIIDYIILFRAAVDG
jgi:hypothetical protein